MDLGNLDDLNSNVQAKKVVEADGFSALATVVVTILIAGGAAVTGAAVLMELVANLSFGGFLVEVGLSAAVSSGIAALIG